MIGIKTIKRKAEVIDARPAILCRVDTQKAGASLQIDAGRLWGKHWHAKQPLIKVHRLLYILDEDRDMVQLFHSTDSRFYCAAKGRASMSKVASAPSSCLRLMWPIS